MAKSNTIQEITLRHFMRNTRHTGYSVKVVNFKNGMGVLERTFGKLTEYKLAQLKTTGKVTILRIGQGTFHDFDECLLRINTENDW